MIKEVEIKDGVIVFKNVTEDELKSVMEKYQRSKEDGQPFISDIIIRAEPPDPDKIEPGLKLWIDWFEFDGNPWKEDDYSKDCFFCVETYPSHAPDCIFVQAQALVAGKTPLYQERQKRIADAIVPRK